MGVGTLDDAVVIKTIEGLDLQSLSYGLLVFGFITAVLVFGPLIPARYGWMIMECPASVMCTIMFFYTHSDNKYKFTTVNQLCYAMFLLHYIVRAFVFPFLLHPNSKPMPLAIPISAFMFCAYNGFLQGLSLAQTNNANTTVYDLNVIVGAILFFIGFFINQHADHVLRSARRSSSSHYIIPYGGAYRFVSSANYFGEIVEWFGFAIACNSFAAFSFAVFTLLLLSIRAISVHNWYKQQFKDKYPKNRKAIIPFIL